MKKINLSKEKHRQLGAKRTQPYSLSLDMIEKLEFAVSNIYHEILESGHSSSAPHAHSHKREAIYLVRGSLSVLISNEVHLLNEGECLRFDPGETHLVTNKGNETACYFIFAESHPQDQVRYRL